MRLVDLYLTLYNSVHIVGWYVLFTAMGLDVLSEGLPALSSLFHRYSVILVCLQLLSFLELFHIYFGIVKSAFLPTFIQVIGRNQILFLVIVQIPAVQDHPATGALMIIWNLIELVRYPLYLFTLFQVSNSILTYLRYTMFIPLYPMGITAEVFLYYIALPHIYATGLFTVSLPNWINFSFDFGYYCAAMIPFELIFFPKNYKYMLLQRARKLSSNTQHKRK